MGYPLTMYNTECVVNGGSGIFSFKVNETLNRVFIKLISNSLLLVQVTTMEFGMATFPLFSLSMNKLKKVF